MSPQSGTNFVFSPSPLKVRWRWLFLGLSVFTLSFLRSTPRLPLGSEFAMAQSLESLPLFTFGSRTLELGMAGTDVAELQRRLKQLGYFEGSVTGIFDRATQEAAIQFQRDFRFDADGKAGMQTQTALLEFDRVATPLEYQVNNVWQTDRLVGLRQGSVGLEVQQLQLLLQNIGFPPGNIDSRFGTDTENALIQFQRFYGLSATGVVDERTATDLVRVNDSFLVRVNDPLTIQPIVRETEERNLYVVVIPERSDESLLQSVRWFFPNATLVDTDRRGSYVEVGQFLDRDLAENQSNNVRDRGFDARVVYLRNELIVSTDEPSLEPFNIPTLRPLPVPF